MARFTWRCGSVPEGMEIRQVYGILFSEDGRILLKAEKRGDGMRFSFAGGHPERFDADAFATLVREVREEINSSVKSPRLLGYQEVDEEDGSPLYAQVRMAALLDEVGEILPDPDNGETYMRLLAPPDRAIALLGWGKVAEEQISEAVKVFEGDYCLYLSSRVEEYI